MPTTASPSPSASVRLLLLADTHVPRRARALPTAVLDAVDGADLVVHAGDWTDAATLDALSAASSALLGVAGNNDGPALVARLPQVARAVVAGVRLEVVHETGAATGRELRCARRHPEADLLVFGHSHIPWDSSVQRGDGTVLRLLNPGSPTDRRRQPHATFLTAVLHDGAVHDVVLHRL